MMFFLLAFLFGLASAEIDGTGCPSSFQGRCTCGMKTNPQFYPGKEETERFTVECDGSGFNNADMLKDVPTQTEVLIFKGNYVPEMPLHLLNGTDYEDLDVIDMSNNHINIIKGRTFHKVWNVRHLILDHNNLEITDEEHPRMFSNFENLERLHMTNAFTEDVNATDTLLSFEDILYESDLRFLKVLHMEQNEIWEIGSDERVFCQLPALEQLMLGDNRLTDMDFVIDCLPELFHIDLERNNIARLSENAMNRLDDYHGAPTRQDQALKVNLGKNPFECDCRSIEFVDWLGKTKIPLLNKEAYTCMDGYPQTNVNKKLLKVEDLDCPVSRSSVRWEHMGPKIEIHGYSSATIGVLSFFLVFVSSLLLAVAYFHKEKFKSIVQPHYDYITRRLGYTGIANEEVPKEVNV